MKIHELKIDTAFFQATLEGRKKFEIRKDDRQFQAGDLLHLRETTFTGEQMKMDQPAKPLVYTGREISAVVTYILRGPIYGLDAGWVIMSIHANISQ